MKTNIISEYKNIIEISKNLYEILKNCVSTDLLRDSLNYVYLDKSLNKTHLVATNGKVMFYYNITGSLLDNVEKGYFQCVTKQKAYYLIPINCNDEFPNWRKVIPNYDLKKRSKAYTFSGNQNNDKDSEFIFDVTKALDRPIRLKHFNVLKYMGEFIFKAEKNTDKGRYPVIFNNENLNYIVMPISNNKEKE